VSKIEGPKISPAAPGSDKPKEAVPAARPESSEASFTGGSRFGVSLKKSRELLQEMAKLGIREQDLEEEFVRSSGPGGQNVNKTSTKVKLRHKPSGIEVGCQRERSQALNRFFARRLLCEKYKELVLGIQSRKQQEREKIRRQKRRRSRRAKEKMLEQKRLHGEKKAGRRKPDF
jgi:peptide chain release factor